MANPSDPPPSYAQASAPMAQPNGPFQTFGPPPQIGLPPNGQFQPMGPPMMGQPMMGPPMMGPPMMGPPPMGPPTMGPPMMGPPMGPFVGPPPMSQPMVPYSPYGPPASPYIEDRANNIFPKHGIPPYVQEDLAAMGKYGSVVLICDDSSSMNTPTEYGKTRWSELKETTMMIIDICSVVYKQGINIHFLNRPPCFEVVTYEQVADSFQRSPSGCTPLVEKLRLIMSKKPEKQRLIIIATDGLPTNQYGDYVMDEMTNLLRTRDCNDNKISILACTNEADVMEYLNRLDREIPGLEVTDDYESEKKEVMTVQQNQIVFNRGVYVARMLLSPIIPEYDRMDEVKLKIDANGKIIKNQFGGTSVPPTGTNGSTPERGNLRSTEGNPLLGGYSSVPTSQQTGHQPQPVDSLCGNCCTLL